MKEYNRDGDKFTIPNFEVNMDAEDLELTITEGEYTGISLSYSNFDMDADNMLSYNMNVLSESVVDDNVEKMAENIILAIMYDVFDNLSNLGENDV